jgi:beta-lactamase class D
MKFAVFFWLAFQILMTKCSALSKSYTRIDFGQFNKILTDNSVRGTLVFLDENSRTLYSNDFERAANGFLPASTFKIFITLVALQEDITDPTGIAFLWDGKSDSPKQWERNMTLKEAFQFSCFPCYRALAHAIGANKMNYYLDCTGYGKMDVHEENIGHFWIEGKSLISPLEQIEFLRSIFHEKFDCFAAETYSKLKEIMVFDVGDSFIMLAKTGWSNSQGQNIGWFVGWVETENNTWFFVANIEPSTDTNEFNFAAARLEVTYRALDILDIVHPPEGF